MLRKILLSFVLLALLGLVILPALAYAVGQFIIGPYAGDNGLLGYLQSIYDALANGSPNAAIIVSAPLGIALTWWGVGWILGQSSQKSADTE